MRTMTDHGKRVTLLLDTEEFAQLEESSARLKIAKTEFVRRALNHYHTFRAGKQARMEQLYPKEAQ